MATYKGCGSSRGRGDTRVMKWFASTFVFTALIILTVTAFGKLVSASGSAQILERHDPVLQIANRKMLVFASVIEIAVVLLVLFAKEVRLKLFYVSWLSTIFLTYRYLKGNDEYCQCLGNLHQYFWISNGSEDAIAKWILVYLFVGGYGLLWSWSFVDTSCPKKISCSNDTDKPVPDRVNRDESVRIHPPPLVGNSTDGVRVKAILFWLSLTSFFGQVQPEARAQEYEVSGTVEQVQYAYTATNLALPPQVIKTLVPFTVKIADCRWFMRMRHFDPSVSDYEEVSFDGTNTYMHASYQTRVAKAVENGTKVGSNLSVGNVRRSQVPRFPEAPCSGIVWATYASHCYFAEVREEMTEIPATLAVRDGASMNPNEFRLFKTLSSLADSQPKLPRTLTYLSGSLNFQKKPYPKPFQGGFTNTEYEAISFTNVFGWALPTLSKMSTYVVYPRRGDAVLLKRYDYLLRSTNISTSPVSHESFQPKLIGKTLIMEERFNSDELRSIMHFAYYASNRWPSESQVMALPIYKETLSSVERSKNLAASRSKKGSNLQFLVYLVLIIAVVVPPYIFFSRKPSINTNKANK